MKRPVWQTSMAIVGSIIGAGFASGQEISTFFSRFGRLSWLGIIIAVCVLVWTLGRIRRLPAGRLWRVLFGLLTIVTGGAMLACSGEIAALAIPVHGAYGLGMVFMLGMVVFANGRCDVLSGVSRVLIVFLLVLLGSGCLFPGEGAVLGESGTLPLVVISGLCYGGINAALAVPSAAEADPDERWQALRRVVMILGLLLAAGNAAMLRHPELQDQSMPLVRLASRYGRLGYYACCITMALAVLTTAIAADKGLSAMLPKRLRLLGPCLMLLTALLGFREIVAWVYPVLGGSCFLLLIVSGTTKTGAGGHFCSGEKKDFLLKR